MAIRSFRTIDAKDLINLGLFTVLYFILVIAASMLGFIPIFIPLLAVICPFIGGIPFMLYLTRVKKFGLISLMGLLMGILMLVGGMGPWSILTGAVFGLLADLTLQSGDYASASRSVLGYGIFSMYTIGNFIPIVINRDGYYQGLVNGGYGKEYADRLMSYMPSWILPVLLVTCFVFGILGGLLGRRLLRKHFIKAGIA